MRAKTQELIRTSWLTLTKNTSRVSGRIHYTVRVQFWAAPANVRVEDVRTLFNPNRNQGQTTSWKFRSRKEAEQLMTAAMLKWGA